MLMWFESMLCIEVVRICLALLNGKFVYKQLCFTFLKKILHFLLLLFQKPANFIAR